MGSHSCKTFWLAVAAKHGSFSGFDRRVLGHHAKPGDTSIAEYSRDLLATPLRKLEMVRQEIVRGTFRPDETRSGRFCKPFEAEATQVAQSSESANNVDSEDFLTESEDNVFDNGSGKVEEWSERVVKVNVCKFVRLS